MLKRKAEGIMEPAHVKQHGAAGAAAVAAAAAAAANISPRKVNNANKESKLRKYVLGVFLSRVYVCVRMCACVCKTTRGSGRGLKQSDFVCVRSFVSYDSVSNYLGHVAPLDSVLAWCVHACVVCACVHTCMLASVCTRARVFLLFCD